ncbi:MAG: hypothetical protein UFA98_07955 [Ruminococcus sp.]|nr:hypothetical protein [Ruminococcus sp.]
MEAQEEGEISMNRIPIDDYPECDYGFLISHHEESFNSFLNAGCTILECVNGHYYLGFDYYMDENGMDKFVAMIAGMLFMMEHNDVEPAQAQGTLIDIQDFESGDYDNLFTPEDLILIKKDIQKIKDYIAKRPELLEE